MSKRGNNKGLSIKPWSEMTEEKYIAEDDFIGG